MNKFAKSIPQVQQPQPPAYSDRQFLHTYAAGAFLPLVQATITAALVMLATGVLLYLFNVLDWAKSAVIVGVFIWVAAWLYLQTRWINLTKLEAFLRMDLNGDGQIGNAPPPEPFTINLNDISEETRSFSQKRMDLTEVITREKLIAFSVGLIKHNRPISRREWTPKSTKGFSDDEYRAWQTVMIRSGLIETSGAGFEMTRAGRKFFTYWANQADHTPPPPREEEPEEG
jgi:hypothetical protein